MAKRAPKMPAKNIDAELAWIESRDGTVRPAAVVEFAKNPDTSLHSQFEWDDSKAAHAHRLEQARHVIRVRIRVIDEADNATTRAYVSLPSDRHEDGGYRSIVSVLSDEGQTSELLRMALSELQVCKRRYKQLRELSDVFQAIDEAAATFEAEQQVADVA